ncbi:hypothetical protein [Sphingomonas turrisvirgatae]|uniref:hypothetical protein n=1 Tax=Sphingomonas turrisvirgatae TaxID=1888892 RepID=UPI001301376D|nr:hypothetical protein [Sphingomonas turrisvirgatae]
MKYKGNDSFRTTFAAIACTLAVSTTVLVGGLGQTAPAVARGAAVTTAQSI